MKKITEVGPRLSYVNRCQMQNKAQESYLNYKCIQYIVIKLVMKESVYNKFKPATKSAFSGLQSYSMLAFSLFRCASLSPSLFSFVFSIPLKKE